MNYCNNCIIHCLNFEYFDPDNNDHIWNSLSTQTSQLETRSQTIMTVYGSKLFNQSNEPMKNDGQSSVKH